MNFLRKALCILFAFTMLTSTLAAVPFSAGAASGVDYIFRSWDGDRVVEENRICSSYSTIGSQDSLTIGSGNWYVLNGDATIQDRVTVTGTAHIILLSGTLTCKDGIRLSNGNTLNIYSGNSSAGTLTAKIKGNNYANVGGNENETCGTLNFHGGTLKAENDGIWTYGAAIGGGEKGGAGDLYFYGGTVTAKNVGVASAKCTTGAAIGSGGFEENKAPTGSVNIYGGEITASCYRYSTAAAIGGGEESKCPPIHILGGKVTARGSEGAGIGTGQEGISDTITIRCANINAEGDLGAAIGSGEESDAGSILIERSSVTADVCVDGSGKGNEGAAIGGGNSGSSTYIKIDKSVVSAYAAKYGAGIGGGDEGSGGVIEITDSDVFACSGLGGAGIGGGDEKGCDSIIIKRSYVAATTASEINTAEKRFLDSYGSDFDTIALYLAENPVITEEAAYYSAGSLTAMLIANLVEGTRTGAGIGSGHGGTANSILIEDSVVVATGGDCAAGIGGGINGGFGTIDIKNSKIRARSVTDGAGIGSGESGTCGTINITDDSDVLAEGGPYGAGIGGGDDSSAGTINIRHSSVSAYGGTDAAGIGGGEGGNGGTIRIDNADVYAQGREYGAGIGGGEDCGVQLVSITGKNSNVVAVAGSNGNSVAIGNGDYNSFFYSCPDIHVALSSSLKVRAGSSSNSTSVYTEKSRFEAVWSNKYAKIYLCEHDNIVWRGETSAYHSSYCVDCGTSLTSTAAHDWDNRDICKVCGVAKHTMNLTFVEKNANGQEIRLTETVFGADDYALPACENVPDGYGFLSWKVTYSGGYFYFHAPGERLIPQSLDPVIEAMYLPLKETTYIDESGKERTVMAKQVSALQTTEFLLVVTDGWYVVDRTLDLWGRIRVQGDVRFIVEDGCSLSAEKFENRYGGETLIWYDPGEYSSFSLYGQKDQTGVFDAGYYYSSAYFSIFRQYGAVFKVEAAIFDKSGSIYAGTFDTYSDTGTDDGEIRICGGNVYVGRLSLNEEIGMELGWTNLSDRFSLAYFINRGPITIKDGQAFIDDNGTIYTESITTDQQDALSANIAYDKTLRPYIGHDYADPEWVWDNEYTDATAVFRCKDCADVQEIKAKVTHADSGKNRTAIARCLFNGQEYSTTEIFRIIFDITVADAAHGFVAANKTTAKKGDCIKLELVPEDSYVLAQLYYTDTDGSKTVIDGSGFTMPESDVTVQAEFGQITYVDEVKPYIDENGAYHLGNVSYAEINGVAYEINEDGSIGEPLDSVALSYFDFSPIHNDSAYQIEYYTGPTEGLTTLVIPKTFNGKPITVIGNDVNDSGDPRCRLVPLGTPGFTLVLHENITEIKPYAFYVVQVTAVTGSTERLQTIGAYAFSWANSGRGYALDIRLDFPGSITMGSSVFNHMNVTARVKHATTFTTDSFGHQQITYVLTDDAHTYGEPVWTWAADHNAATAAFSCTNPRCLSSETVHTDAISRKVIDGKLVSTAVVELNGQTYTDAVEEDCNGGIAVVLVQSEGGSASADKQNAAPGEKVTIIAAPDEGYMITSVKCDYYTADGAWLSGSIYDTKENAYALTVSDCGNRAAFVVVTATFKNAFRIIDATGGKLVFRRDHSGDIVETAYVGQRIWVYPKDYVGDDDEGCVLESITITDEDGNEIAVTENTFTMPDSDVTVSAAFDPRDVMSVTIDDGIGVNFYLGLDHPSREGVSSVTLRYKDFEGNAVEKTYAKSEMTVENGRYKLTVRIAPAQLADVITVIVGGTEIPASVLNYCNDLEKGDYETAVKNVATALKQYAQAAKVAFNYPGIEIADVGSLTAANGFDEWQYTFADSTGKIGSIAFLALTKPEFRFYMTDDVTEAQAAACTVTASFKDGTAAGELKARFAKNAQGDVLVEVTGIKAEDIDRAVVVTINGLGDTTKRIEFTGYDFAKLMAESGNNADLGVALYNYGVAASTIWD